jgi:hypothetical protein
MISAGEFHSCSFVNYFTKSLCHTSNELAAAAVGTTSFGGVTYSTKARNITGLLVPGSAGVNHGH